MADSFVEFLTTDNATVAVRVTAITAVRDAGDFALPDAGASLILRDGATILLQTTFETALTRIRDAEVTE